MIGRAGALAVTMLAAAPAAVGADSFEPIQTQVQVAPVARLHKPLRVRVSVSADPGAMDVPGGQGKVRARVKLTAGECGGTFATTPGVKLLDRPLSPQPAPGAAYHGSAAGSGRPNRYGVQTVCVFLENDYQDIPTGPSDHQVNVSRACTTAAARYDRARRHHRHARKTRKLKRRARKACGPGVPL